MSARSKQVARMSAGVGTPKKPQVGRISVGRPTKPISLTSVVFYPIKVSVHTDAVETECGECDFKIDMHTLIVTTFNEIESLQNYHLICYTKSPNHIHFDWPDCSARIHNLNRLTTDQQLLVQQILLPDISLPKFQLRPETSLQNILEIQLQKTINL